MTSLTSSPPLVVAYALAGRVDLDLTKDPLGYDPSGQPVYLKDIWPSPAEVQAAIENLVEMESAGELTLKCFSRPVAAFDVRALRA